MKAFERSILILRPTTLFFTWFSQLSNPEHEGLTLKNLQDDSTAIMLPHFFEQDQMLAYFEEIYLEFFELELTLWCEDENDWPKDRSFETFKKWFDLELHTTLFAPDDLPDDEIDDDDLDLLEEALFDDDDDDDIFSDQDDLLDDDDNEDEA